ncbi:MAG: PAS domain-containing sensor histidine kinase [Candidatus Latescibacterota bacterium]|nr:MAG: PAS domain-containing sensor histidine kinase [Candidatus Latescibacterota bacterium]
MRIQVKTPFRARRFRGSRLTPFRITGVYLLVALLWTIIRDQASGIWSDRSLGVSPAWRLLELVFVAASSIVVYALTEQFTRAIRKAETECKERFKELTCLYGIAQLSQMPKPALPSILKGIVKLIPPAMQHPDVAECRIRLDDQEYASAGFAERAERLRADIIVGGHYRGAIDVVYTAPRPRADIGPFLDEEQALLVTVARQTALIVERRRGEEERERLSGQLRHADRLATIGQLAAGVAHELNEPIATVLGYAQLSKKSEGVPREVAGDLERIEKSALHAREVVRKLLIFSRQMPSARSMVNLNQVVREGIYFLESRCAKAGIEIERELATALPELYADASQLHQILVNLVVNAVQAMPNGGKLTLRTARAGDSLVLSVEDTGVGIPEELHEKIFLPFFTTKDVREGTGLGLAVVHGIVTAHGGSIGVTSEPGRGSKFEVRLPLVDGPEPAGRTEHGAA